MSVRSRLPRLGLQEGAGQVTQKAYGTETLLTATGLDSPPDWDLGNREKRIHIY